MPLTPFFESERLFLNQRNESSVRIQIIVRIQIMLI